MSKSLIFAGTTEGRKLAEVLSGKNIECIVCVGHRPSISSFCIAVAVNTCRIAITNKILWSSCTINS